MQLRRLIPVSVVAAVTLLLVVPLLSLAEAPDKSAAAKPATQDGEKEPSLSAKQDAIALRFKQFEKMLLQMAEYMRKTDPDRHDLLARAIGRSNETGISRQMEQLIALLEKEQFGAAVERQADVIQHLKALLQLLQSEDRMSELDKEKLRIKDLLKNLNKVIAKEKDVRAGTERGGDPGKLAGRQKKVAEETKKLEKKIDSQDAKRNSDGEVKPGEGKGKPDDGKGKPDDGKGKPGEGKGKPSAGKDKPGEGKGKQPGEGKGKPGEGKGKLGEGKGKPGDGKGKPGEGQDKPGEPSDSNRTPGREEIEQARKDMERAIQELKNKNHDRASGHQDDAVAKLQKAKEKLEQILRQLREEERELLLAALEARFQKMLAMQLLVYNGTVNLGKTSQEDWQDRHDTRSRELAQTEKEIVLDATKTLMLLKEEGSSVAFPEAVEQLRDDMQTVVRLLERSEVGDLTQSIERDIIEALEEVIEALQKEMEKKKAEQQQADQQQNRPRDPALVDVLAELKMLRTLQMRINRRTKRLGNLIDGDQATDPDIVEQLQKLASRQSRIQQATYDLATGKNK